MKEQREAMFDADFQLRVLGRYGSSSMTPRHRLSAIRKARVVGS